MAAAIISAAAGLVPILTPVVADLIARLTHRAAPVAQATVASAPARLVQVVGTVTTGLQAAADAGAIPAMPPPETVATAVQSVVSSMKASGALASFPAPPDAPPALPAPAAKPAPAGVGITLQAGQTVILTLGGQSVTITTK